MTNLPGILILGLAKAQLIQIFFFRLNLLITVLGLLHGLVFLPVILSYLGECQAPSTALASPPRRAQDHLTGAGTPSLARAPSHWHEAHSPARSTSPAQPGMPLPARARIPSSAWASPCAPVLEILHLRGPPQLHRDPHLRESGLELGA